MGKTFFGLISCAAFLFIGCEDPGLLKSDTNFSKSSLRTVYVDTFSVVTSTILIDSLPTSGSGQLLLGAYKDSFLGNISASTYFQIGYQTAFAPDQNSTFDSIGLVLPYSNYYFGDTTQTQAINVYQTTAIPKLRAPLPYRVDENLSFFVSSSQAALYNGSKVSYDPTPIATANVKFSPRRDSLYITLPKSLGQNWFDIAQADALASNSSYFNNPSLFISDFFNGIHLAVGSNTNASIVGFRASKVKVRLYYKRYFGDILQQTYFDFRLSNGSTQFNNIQSDRSSTPLAALKSRQAIPSSATGNVTYVQEGVGLATKIEFPFLKSFFSRQNFILVDAALEIVPILNTYSPLYRVPSPLSLFITDQSNVVLNRAPGVDRTGYLSANIVYDFEYGVNTKYSFPMVNFLGNELASSQGKITSLVLASPPPAYFSEVNRVVLGDQRNSQYKIKLKIYYSYVQNQ